jgi:phage/plasmid-like protein (TIGR03299 family)
MAHQIEIIKGQAQTFYVGETPWHGLGTKLENPPSIKEAITFAGLNWNVSTHQLSAHVQVGVDTEGQPIIKSVQAPAKAVIRSTDQSVLGVVGENYVPVQNETAFDFFQPAVDAGLVSLETAGSLHNGKRIWILAKLIGQETEIVEGDTVNPYVLLSNGHDGKCSIEVGPTAIRVVCQNTLSIAQRSSKLLKVRHTKNVELGLLEIRAALDLQKNEFQASVKAMQRMAQFGVNTQNIKDYIKEVFEPEIRTRTTTADSAQKSYDNLNAKIIPLFENGRGNTLPGVKNTMWSLYNGVTEYLTHEKGREIDNRIENLWFGASKKTSERAFEIAQKMAA